MQVRNLLSQIVRLMGLGMLASLMLLVAGCPSTSDSQGNIHGSVYGGRQPVAGSTVVAYEMSATANGTPVQIGSVVTGSGGNFSMTFTPTPVNGQIVYLEATGGNAGSGTNSAISLMTVAGQYCSGSNCSFPTSVNIDELSTVVSVAAMRLYMDLIPCSNITNNTQPGSSICVGLSGDNQVSPMFAQSVAAQVDLTTGQAAGFLTSQSSSSPIHLTLEKANTLADVLATCVNSSGPTSSACASLFGATLNNASDTLTAAYDIATSPVINADSTTIYGLLPATPVYTPVVTAAPANWTIAGNVYSYAANFGNGSSSGDVSAWQVATQAGVSLLPITSGGAGTCGTTPDPGNCYTAGIGPESIAITPGGQFVYAANGNSGNISAWAVDPGTGELVPVTSGAISCGTGLPSNCFTDGNGPGTVTVNSTGTFLYSINASNGVSVFSINPSSGALTPISGSPFPAGNGASEIVLDATGNFAYVSNFYGDDISAYTINPATGALTNVAGSSCGSGLPSNCFDAGNQPEGMSIDPTGLYLYAGNRNCASPPTCTAAGNISAWSINTTSGALTPITLGTCNSTPDPGNCVNSGIDPYEVTATADGYLYSVNPEGSDLSGYSINSSTGALAALSASSCGVSPDAGNCFASTPDPVSLTGGPHTLIVTNVGTSNYISIYAVDPGTGALTPSSAATQYTADLNSQGITIDPTDRYAYVTNGSGNIDQYTLDSLTGAMSLSNTISSNNAVGSNVAIDPSGRYLYSPGSGGGNQVAAFSIGPADGSLSPVTGNSCGTGGNNNCFAAGPYPEFVSVDDSGKFLYVSNSNCATSITTCTSAGSVSAYTIDPTTGALTNVAGSSCGASMPSNCFAAGLVPFGLKADPAAGLLYVANAGGNDVSGYTINSTTGALTDVAGSSCGTGLPSNCFAAGTPPVITLTPNGAFNYASNYGSDSVSAFSVNSSTGVLTPVDGTAACGGSLPSICFEAGNVPFVGAVTPNDAYYYVTNRNGNDVSAYSIDSSTGVLTPITTGGAGACGVTNDPNNCFAAGSNPQGIAVDPMGHYVYVMYRNCPSSPCSNPGYVSAYDLDPTTGALTPVSFGPTFAAGLTPYAAIFGP